MTWFAPTASEPGKTQSAKPQPSLSPGTSGQSFTSSSPGPPEDAPSRRMTGSKTAFDAANAVLRELGSDGPGPAKPSCVRDLLTALVQIRNKTKTHGAVGQDFYLAANSPYLVAVSYVIQSCPAISWRWLHLSVRESGKNRAIHLLRQDPQHLKKADASKFTSPNPASTSSQRAQTGRSSAATCSATTATVTNSLYQTEQRPRQARPSSSTTEPARPKRRGSPTFYPHLFPSLEAKQKEQRSSTFKATSMATCQTFPLATYSAAVSSPS